MPFDLEIAEGWLPTAASINALPLPVRRYIMMIETEADPSGTQREIILRRDQVHQLETRVVELERQLAEERRRRTPPPSKGWFG